MDIRIEDACGCEIKAIVDDIQGLEVPITVDAYYEPEDDQYVECRRVAHQPATISIERTRVYVGEIHGIEKYVDVHLDNNQKIEIMDGLLDMKEKIEEMRW